MDGRASSDNDNNLQAFDRFFTHPDAIKLLLSFEDISHHLENASSFDDMRKRIAQLKTQIKGTRELFMDAQVLDKNGNILIDTKNEATQENKETDTPLILLRLREFCQLSEDAVDEMAMQILSQSCQTEVSALQKEIRELEQSHSIKQEKMQRFVQRSWLDQLTDFRRDKGLTTKEKGSSERSSRSENKNITSQITLAQKNITQKKQQQHTLIKKLSKKLQKLKIQPTLSNTFFQSLSDHLLNKELNLGIALINDFQNNTEISKKIIGTLPEPLFETLFDIKSRVMLFQSIIELDDAAWLNKHLTKYIVGDLVKKAREAMFTPEGALQTELFELLNMQSNNAFGETYLKLTPEKQKEITDYLLFSLVQAGIKKMTDTYFNKIIEDEIQVQKFMAFQQAFFIPDLIHHAIHPMHSPQTHPVEVTSLYTSFFSHSPLSPKEKFHALPRYDVAAFQLTDLCKKTLIQALAIPEIKTQSKIMAGYSNRIMQYITNRILQLKSVEERAVELGYWIRVANECFKSGDFHTMQSIRTTLSAWPIDRLKNTYSLLDQETQTLLSDLNKKCNSHKNLQNETIEKINDSKLDTIPFFGAVAALSENREDFSGVRAQYKQAYQKIQGKKEMVFARTPLQDAIINLPATYSNTTFTEQSEQSKKLEPAASQKNNQPEKSTRSPRAGRKH